jgi:hypothetical protein
MTTVVAWLTSTSIGNTLLKWTGIAAIVAAGYWRIYASGKAAAEADRVADELNALKEKERVHARVQKMGSSDLDRELARWVRHDN